MSYTPDMEEISPHWFAVGWLNPDHPFPRRAPTPEFLERINEFARRWIDSVHALDLGIAMGFHTCEFCGDAHASGTFAIPAGDHIFYCPEMIAHYVERHEYAPPQAFVDAVLACPLPGTPEYDAASAPSRSARYE